MNPELSIFEISPYIFYSALKKIQEVARKARCQDLSNDFEGTVLFWSHSVHLPTTSPTPASSMWALCCVGPGFIHQLNVRAEHPVDLSRASSTLRIPAQPCSPQAGLSRPRGRNRSLFLTPLPFPALSALPPSSLTASEANGVAFQSLLLIKKIRGGESKLGSKRSSCLTHSFSPSSSADLSGVHH